MKSLCIFLWLSLAIGAPLYAQRPLPPEATKLVVETQSASIKLREAALRKTIAKTKGWPDGVWGDNLWCLSALYLNERTDEANARLLKQAKDFLSKKPEAIGPTLPEAPGDLPSTFFSVTDYVRTLCLFHAKSRHFPGRLKPETEAAMKEALWFWVSSESKLSDVGADDLFLLLGTENHDLNRRPAFYLVTSLLQEDPLYRDRKLRDGHTTSEHAAAYTNFYREWPRRRAQTGLWIEVGSNTYQKYSWPSLFNLHELAPDPLVRQRFGLLLDLAFIEEAQIAVNGQRGGGISRGDYAPNPFAAYKNLLFAVDGQPAASSHSRVIETSRYQAPAEAVLLARRAIASTEPFVIRNRILGQLDSRSTDIAAGTDQEESKENRINPDSALVNYAYRAPHYVLGGAQLDPRLNYAGISNQKRACGMLFDNPGSSGFCSVHSVIQHGQGGRPQRSFWSIQEKNVLILQRIPPGDKKHPGSYNTEAIGIGFDGSGLKKTEPAKFNKATDRSRILLIAGDVSQGLSFQEFQSSVLANPPRVGPEEISIEFGPGKDRIEMTSFDPKTPDKFKLPRINGKPVDLHPGATYQSPYLNGAFNGDTITVTVGPIRRVLDFSAQPANR